MEAEKKFDIGCKLSDCMTKNTRKTKSAGNFLKTANALKARERNKN